MRIALTSVIAGLVAVLAVILAAVALASDGDNSEMEAQVAGLETQVQQLQGSLDQLQESLDRTQLVAALTFLDGVGFHGIDDDLQAASEIPGGVSGSIESARRVAEVTQWPEELGTEAEALLAALRDFEAALHADDLAGAKEGAAAAHDNWHDLEGVAYPFLTGEEPAHHDDESEGQPEGETEGEHGEEEEEHGG